MVYQNSTLLHKFMRFVLPEPNSGCWLWTGNLTSQGYGRFVVPRKTARKHTDRAYRVAWELLIGPVPEGKELDHLCRVRCCVNPQHLEPVSHRENLLRGSGATVTKLRWATRREAMTHCVNGHEYTLANTRIDADGGYSCRTCDRLAMRKHRLRSLISTAKT